MILTQKWIPDTHDIELTCEWDDENPEAGQVCIEAKYPDGSTAADPQSVFAAVLLENQMKNQALALIVEMLPQTMKKAELDSDGDPTGVYVIKDKHQPQWEFGEADGLISFTIPGLEDEDLIASIGAALNTEFGGAVTLN